MSSAVTDDLRVVATGESVDLRGVPGGVPGGRYVSLGPPAAEPAAVEGDADGVPEGVYTPHRLIGGVRQFAQLVCKVDYLCVSVSESVAKALLRETALNEDRYTGVPRGFAKAEYRTCFGGDCHRSWDPHIQSSRLGPNYERWEWKGGHVGNEAAKDLRRLDGVIRPTRVDICWDFMVPEGYRPEDFRDAVMGLGVAESEDCWGITGQGGVNTVYLNGRTAGRAIRVYRKDLESPWEYPSSGAVMRLELILKGERARRWWSVWQEDPSEAVGLAAGEVHELSGVSCSPEWMHYEPLPTKQARSVAERIQSKVEQDAGMLAALHRVGLLDEFIEKAVAQESELSRASRYRWKAFSKEVERVGIAAVRSALGWSSDAKGARGSQRGSKASEFYASGPEVTGFESADDGIPF
jgi:hypothetical protein